MHFSEASFDFAWAGGHNIFINNVPSSEAEVYPF
jgi:hypothetical protein